jgi:hypothetical protein
MILSPQSGGFPLVNEMRSAGGAFFRPLEPLTPEDDSSAFEKVFAEFLAGLDRREEGERESLRDREIRVREDAGAQTRGAAETGVPGKPETRREAEAPREDETQKEAQALRETEAPREAAGQTETLQETGAFGENEISWGILAWGDTGVGNNPVPARSGDMPEGDREASSGELRLAGLESQDFVLQGRGGVGQTEALGWGLPSAEPAAAVEGESPSREPLSPAAKEGKAKKTAGERNARERNTGEKTAGTPVLRESPEGPVFTGEVPEGAAAGERAGEAEVFLPSGEEGTGETSPIPVLALDPAGGMENFREIRDREGQEEDRRGIGRIELRDQRKKVSPGLSPKSAGQSSGQPSGFSGQSPGSSSGQPFGQLPLQSGPEFSAGTLSRDSPQAGLNPPVAGEAGFGDLLARELRQNLNSEIVRHAQLILRDRGEGSIRLSLRPESLGNVKIRLELTENRIAGHIVVESGEALRAFEREIAALEQAFRDSGYESAELSLSQDGSGGGEEEGEPFYSPRFAEEKARYDEMVERTDTSFLGLPENGLGPGNGHIQVNMLI